MDMFSMSTRNSGMPVQQGVIQGGAAFILGMILMIIVGSVGLSVALAFTTAMGVWGIATGYLALHLGGLVTGSSSGVIVWSIIPIVVLLVSGYWVASRSGGGFTEGASVTVGYFLLALVATIIYLAMPPNMASGSTGVADAVVHLISAGVVFPVVFGGIGGLLAAAV